MVVVLFTRPGSVYARMGLEVYDRQRDARTYCGDQPVIAHPPCRGWGRYHHKSKHEPGELELAYYALAQVRLCGGVLEHPSGSRFWRAAGLPAPGESDAFGGQTFQVDQVEYGHRARKRTWLDVVGYEGLGFPEPHFPGREPVNTVENMGRAERESTPECFARALIDLATHCKRVNRDISG